MHQVATLAEAGLTSAVLSVYRMLIKLDEFHNEEKRLSRMGENPS